MQINIFQVPRKCFAMNRILDCKDTAFVLITLNTDGWNLENKKDKKIIILQWLFRVL